MKEFGTNFLELLKAGNELSYKRLFDEYYPGLCVFAKKYTNDLDTAKEIVQDLFVKLYADRKSISFKTSLKSYLYQSVKNRCLNYIKHNKIVAGHLENIKSMHPEEPGDWSDKMIETELEVRIFELVSELPKKCQKIYKMSRVKGLTNKQIADKLSISVRTVETQISHALKVLRINLQDYLKK